MLPKANAAYRQSKALEELNRVVQTSTKGARPLLDTDVIHDADGNTVSQPRNIHARDFTNPEVVEPKGFLDRLNKMYNSTRLHDAMGQLNRDNESLANGHANTLYKLANGAVKTFNDLTTMRNNLRTVAKLAASIGIGGAGAIVGAPVLASWIRHLLGE